MKLYATAGGPAGIDIMLTAKARITASMTLPSDAVIGSGLGMHVHSACITQVDSYCSGMPTTVG